MSLTRRTLVSILVILNCRWVACTECIDGDYAPDPYDCNGYFQCQFGRWIQRNCPRELHFNRLISTCDFPWNANCELLESTTTSTTTTPDDPTPTPTDPPTSSPPTDPPTGSPPTDPPTGSPPTYPPTGSPPTDKPTSSPPTDPPTGSPPTTTTTAPTTSTSPPTTTTTVTPSPTITTTTLSPTTTGPPTTTTLLPTQPPTLECVTNDGQYVLHLPHPNCTMFYKCVHGIPHEMLCPFAQHWAMALDRCDSPSEANCVDGAARKQLNARPPNYW